MLVDKPERHLSKFFLYFAAFKFVHCQCMFALSLMSLCVKAQAENANSMIRHDKFLSVLGVGGCPLFPHFGGR